MANRFLMAFCAILVILSLAFLFPVLSFAKEPTRVGYVDLKFIFENSVLKNRLYAEFMQQKSQLKRQIRNLALRKRKLELLYAKQYNLLGYQEAMAEEKKLQEKILNLEKQIDRVKKDIKSWENENMAILFDEIINALSVISKEENIQLFLSRESALVYGDTDLDYTQRVIDLINAIDERNTPSAK
ncbi:MAG: OmpH family outer membrane protein [Candidatus Hydrogenedentota bacterium]|nr:MAG: OmpH family outer membrane protein [Candidatus Hydrogenedentota bacterium]